MKAHSNNFMPEFSVSGKGGIPMENDFQDNNFGARTSVLKMAAATAEGDVFTKVEQKPLPYPMNGLEPVIT
jgi:hypothetical protein